MAISDTVLLNTKGDINTAVEEVLQIAVYALKRLEITTNCPDFYFVLRDVSDTNPQSKLECLEKVQNALAKIALELKFEINDYLRVRDNLEIMNQAFNEGLIQLNSNNTLKVIDSNPNFSEKCRELKKKLVESTKQSKLTGPWFSTVKVVWQSISVHGELYNFKDIKEYVARKDLETEVNKIISTSKENFKKIRGETDKIAKENISSKEMDAKFHDLLKKFQDDFESDCTKQYGAYLEGKEIPEKYKREFVEVIKRQGRELYSDSERYWYTTHRTRLYIEERSKEAVNNIINWIQEQKKKENITKTELELRKDFDDQWTVELENMKRAVQEHLKKKIDIDQISQNYFNSKKTSSKSAKPENYIKNLNEIQSLEDYVSNHYLWKKFQTLFGTFNNDSIMLTSLKAFISGKISTVDEDSGLVLKAMEEVEQEIDEIEKKLNCALKPEFYGICAKELVEGLKEKFNRSSLLEKSGKERGLENFKREKNIYFENFIVLMLRKGSSTSNYARICGEMFSNRIQEKIFNDINSRFTEALDDATKLPPNQLIENAFVEAHALYKSNKREELLVYYEKPIEFLTSFYKEFYETIRAKQVKSHEEMYYNTLSKTKKSLEQYLDVLQSIFEKLDIP